MAFTTSWSPNQSAIAQQETYTFSAPSGVGNTYSATINGKTVAYSSVGGDTAATAATALLNLLVASTIPELAEIGFGNPSAGVLTATAAAAGTPFANVTVNGVPGQGLVLSTGNGLSNGVATAHTQANQSPSDAADPQNWLRVNTGVTPPSQTRAIPVNGDNVVVANTSVPLLWNLDALIAVQFGSYQRSQSFTGTAGLPENNPGGYTESRQTYFCFVGPQGSVPAGGLSMLLGYNSGSGSGPTRERYNLGSQQYSATVLAAGSAADEWGVRLLGVHTNNAVTLLGTVSVGVAMLPGEVSQLNSSTVDGGGSIGVGAGVTWTSGAVLTLLGGTATLNSAPATLTMANGAAVSVTTGALTWAAVTAQGGCSLTFLAGGTITSLTTSVSCTLDATFAGALTIVNSTIDGDTCQILDPNNAVTFINATTVKQAVTSGPLQFTGTRTLKLT